MSNTQSPGSTSIDEEVRLQEYSLTNDKFTLYVSPWGASIRGFVADGVTEIVTRYQGKDKVGGQGDVLIPFPGRVNHGMYTFEGESYSMVKNDAEGPNAIHGFLRSRPWTTLEHSETSATFAVDLAGNEAPGYPFPLHVEITYEVTLSGFMTSYVITNTGPKDAPVGAGFHPYFTVGMPSIDDSALTVPFESYLVYNEGMVPTGEVSPVTETPFNFLAEKVISTTKLNTCFLDPIRSADGMVSISLRSLDAGRSVNVKFGPEVDYVVLYTGDALPDSHRRKSLAIEPMSCGSDAFNHPEWGLTTLKPGGSLKGKWAVEYVATL